MCSYLPLTYRVYAIFLHLGRETLLTNSPVPFRLTSRTYQDAERLLEDSRRNNDGIMWHYYQRLLQTANDRYNVHQPNLNRDVNQTEATRVRPMRFRTWLESVWGRVV